MSVLVGKPAPDFSLPAVLADGTLVEDFTLSEAVDGRPALVFFYPHGFTGICASELTALDRQMDTLAAAGIVVVAVSIDSAHAHSAWRNTPVEQGGIGPVRFPLAADLNHDAVRAYGVESAGGMAYRGSFLLDQDGFVRAQLVNDLPLGRSIDELLRLVDALEFNQAQGKACPADWRKGDPGL